MNKWKYLNQAMRALVACLVQLVAYIIKTPGYVYKFYSAFLVSWE